MSTAAIVTMFLGGLIICSRGLLIVAPAFTLRWFGKQVQTEGRTRVFGAIVILIALPMVWSGVSENTELAALLLIFGIFFLVISIPMLVLFPRFYMSFAASFLPDDSTTDLVGWQMLGLLGVIVGIAIFYVGITSL